MFSLKLKELIFDAKVVVDRAEKATRGVLKKFGAFVRQRAKTSIRPRKQSSAPGNPPSRHSRDLREAIIFATEPGNVVIGPYARSFANRKNAVPAGGGTIPEVIEHGGVVNAIGYFRQGLWVFADLRSRRRLAGMKILHRRIRYAARPFMRPAFEKEKSKLPAMWAGAVK